MRVVYDTNVLATTFSSRSEIQRLKHAILSDRIMLITSSFILNELETVLVSRFGLTRQSAKARKNLLARIAEVVRVLNIEKVARDPDDDFVLATALAGHANYILTHDKDLLVLNEYEGIKIVPPAVFWNN